jgi:hypothetical protein
MSDVQILRCPGCQEYIASDSTRCRFCSRPLDAQTIKTAVEATQVENKKYRRRHYLKHMFAGLGIFAAGVAITFVTVAAAFSSEAGGFYIVTWGLIVAGAGDFLYGLFGLLGEAFSKK